MTKKTVPIDRLMVWAYREELPKALMGGSSDAYGGRAMETLAELGTLVDLSNAYGCVPDSSAEPGEPHPDAKAIADALRAIDDGAAFLPAINSCDWLVDLAGLTAAEREAAIAVGHARARTGLQGRGLAALIVRLAMLGHVPDWRGDWLGEAGTVDAGAVPTRSWKTRPGGRGPVWRILRSGDDGETVEIDGYDYRTMRPKRGAWRVSELSADLGWLVARRMEHDAWGESLGAMRERLSGVLADHVPGAPAERKHPWQAAPKAAIRGVSTGPAVVRQGRGARPLQKSA